MLYLIGQVVRVSDPIQQTNKESGEVSNVWKVQVQHTRTDSANAELALESLKLKSQQQADAFRKCLGKQMRVPVGLYAFGDTPGLWLEKDVLPTPLEQAKAA